MNEIQTIIYGFPNYEKLSMTEKRLLILPLVQSIQDFYKDPENRRKFELWKANKEKLSTDN